MDALKSALVSALVLTLLDFSKPFQLQTDASDLGVGAVLLQDGHPLAFVSKAPGPRTRALSTYENEFLAILVAVEQWRSYLQHSEFTIFTDQRSLMHITNQRLQTQWQLKMHTKLHESSVQGRLQARHVKFGSRCTVLSPQPAIPTPSSINFYSGLASRCYSRLCI